jgi:hypothetical protein
MKTPAKGQTIFPRSATATPTPRSSGWGEPSGCWSRSSTAMTPGRSAMPSSSWRGNLIMLGRADAEGWLG